MPEIDGRIIFEGDQERWSDRCATCGHSRADHLVHPGAVGNLFAVSNCNSKGGSQLKPDPDNDCKCEVFS